MITHRAGYAVLVAGLLSLGGCGILSDGLAPTPKSEIPPGSEEGYLKAGPVTGVDHGPAQKSLLKEYVDTKNQMKALQERLGKLEEKLRISEAALAECRKERDQEKAGRIGAEAERDKALQDLRDKEIQLLNLALEKTKVEQELVKLRIQALSPPAGEETGAGPDTAMGGGPR